jgi:hypothetical protein
MTNFNNNFKVKNGLEATDTSTISKVTIGLNNDARAFGSGFLPVNANNMKFETPNNGASFIFAMKNPSGVEKNVGISRQGNIVLQQGILANGFPSGIGLSAQDGGQVLVNTQFDADAGLAPSLALALNTQTGVLLNTSVYDYDTDTTVDNQATFGFDGVFTTPALAVTTTATVGTVKFENGSEITTSTGGVYGSVIKITPAGGTSSTQALLIYPTANDGDHLHLTAGGDQTELYLGNDSHYVKLASSGTVEVRSYSILGTSTAYTFGWDGVFTTPGLAVTNTATVNEVVVGPDLRAIKSQGYNVIGVDGNWRVGNVLEVGNGSASGYITSVGGQSLLLQTSDNDGPGGSISIGSGAGAGVSLYSGASQEFATAQFNTTTNTINYGLTVNGTLAASTVTANSIVTQDLVSSGGFPLDSNGQALIRASSTQTPALVASNYTAGLLPEVLVRGYGQNRPGGPTSTTPGAAGIILESSRGTHTAPTVPGLGDVIGSFSAGSYDGTRWSGDMNIYPAQIIATAAETWAGNATTTTNAGSRLEMWVQPPAVQLNSTSRFRPMRHVWTAGNVGTGTPPILNIHEGSGQDGAPTLTPAAGTGSFGTGSGRVNLVKTNTQQQIFGVPSQDTAADNPSLPGTNSISFISGRRNGVVGRRNKLLSGDTIGAFDFRGQTADNSPGIGSASASIYVQAAENFDSTTFGTTIQLTTTAVGTNASPTTRLSLNSGNNTHASSFHNFADNSANTIAVLSTTSNIINYGLTINNDVGDFLTLTSSTTNKLLIGLNNDARAFGSGYMPANANNMKFELPNNGASLFFAVKNPSGVEKNVGISRQGNIVIGDGVVFGPGFEGGGGITIVDGGGFNINTGFDAGVGLAPSANIAISTQTGIILNTNVYDYDTDTLVNYDLTLDLDGTTTLPGALVYDRTYGTFFNTSTVTPGAANTAYVVPLTEQNGSNNVSFSGTGTVTVAKAGLYNIQYSIQLINTSGSSEHDFDVWFRKNGSDIPNSNTQFTIIKGNGKAVAALNFIENLAANDTFELAYAVTSTAVHIETIAAQSSPYARPATPGVILTVVPVGA